MKKLTAITLRELKVFFQSPYAMVILPVFLLLCGTYFNTTLNTYLTFARPSDTTMKVEGLSVTQHLIVPYFKSVLNVFVFIVPLITMRSFAEEKKLQTYDLLVSYPLRPWQILGGKFLGALIIVMGLLALSGIYLLVVVFKGEPYLPVVGTIYLGYTLFLIFYVAVGVVASLITENQLVAALISYAALLTAVLFQWLAFVSPAPWDRVFAHFLLFAHLESFRHGLVYLGDIPAYLGPALFLLLLGYLRLRRHFIR